MTARRSILVAVVILIGLALVVPATSGQGPTPAATGISDPQGVFVARPNGQVWVGDPSGAGIPFGQAESEPVLAHEPQAGNATGIVRAAEANVAQVDGTYTWIQTTQEDWNAGILYKVDSETDPGSLRLGSHVWSASSRVMAEFAARQRTPSIVAHPSDGNILYAAWTDSRDGSNDIYFARSTDAGQTWQANVRVNDQAGSAAASTEVSLVVGIGGKLYAAWSDVRDDDGDIYLAWSSDGGITWSASVRINDDLGLAAQSGVSLAAGTGDVISAAWTDMRNGNADIYFARSADGGATWCANIRVDDGPGTTVQDTVSLAAGTDGSLHAMWSDSRNVAVESSYYFYDDYDIQYARSSDGGATWTPSRRINDDTTAGFQYEPDLVVSSSGTVYAAWTDGRNAPGCGYYFGCDYDVYFTSSSDGGVTWSPNVRANEVTASGAQLRPVLQAGSAGDVYAAWTDTRRNPTGYTEVYAAHSSDGGATWSANVLVSDYCDCNCGGFVHYSPDLVLSTSGAVHAVWTDWRSISQDIYSDRSTDGGATWGIDRRVNDDPESGQWDPSLALAGNGTQHLTWYSQSCQTCPLARDALYSWRASAGDPWQPAEQINDAPGMVVGWSSVAVAADGAGNAFAVWQDLRNETDGSDIYFSYRPAGGAWGDNVRVNDDPGGSYRDQRTPAIAVDAAGNAHAVWYDLRNDSNDVYSAYRPAGGVWSANVRVNDSAGTGGGTDPTIAVDAGGNALAVWSDYRNGDSDIYFSFRPADGVWGANILVNDDVGTADQTDPAIAVDDAGNAYAVWLDERSGSVDLYFAYRPAGGVWSANVRINDAPGTVQDWRTPGIAVDGDGNARAAWVDTRTYGAIYAAYRPAGGAWGGAARVNDTGSLFSGLAMAVGPAGEALAVWDDANRDNAFALYSASPLPVPEYWTEGTYTSPIFDAGAPAAWQTLTATESTPGDTALAFETRSRNPGGTWTTWTVTEGPIASPPGQFLQVRVEFATASPTVTPVLEQVEITYEATGVPSAPRFTTPCGVTNQTSPSLRGSTAAEAIVHLMVDGTEVMATTASAEGTFELVPTLMVGTRSVAAWAENDYGAGPASDPFALTVDPDLPYDPVSVIAGQYSKDGWLLSPPRDAQGCADPTNNWRVWPRANQPFRVEVPVTYSSSASVEVTVGTQTIALSETTSGLFTGVLLPPITDGEFRIEITADGSATVVVGGPVLIDPDGVVYDAVDGLDNPISGAEVALYYLDEPSGLWLPWDAWNYGQVNPQMTLEDGYYSFYTPPGTYQVRADKPGYPGHISSELVVVDRPVRHNIPLGYPERIYLPLVVRNN